MPDAVPVEIAPGPLDGLQPKEKAPLLSMTAFVAGGNPDLLSPLAVPSPVESRTPSPRLTNGIKRDVAFRSHRLCTWSTASYRPRRALRRKRRVRSSPTRVCLPLPCVFRASAPSPRPHGCFAASTAPFATPNGPPSQPRSHQLGRMPLSAPKALREARNPNAMVLGGGSRGPARGPQRFNGMGHRRHR
jgi:hypothetical protein